MGVKTVLSLEEANHLFETYEFTQIVPTTEGIIDTTYIVHSDGKKYILKRYEEASLSQIEDERVLLERLQNCGLNVPLHLASSGVWHLYSLLSGEIPGSVQSHHLQSLARTIAVMHHCTKKMRSEREAFPREKSALMLASVKSREFALYKQLSSLLGHQSASDGIIHADLFLDNVLFHKCKAGVIDFIDAGEGSFAFDLGVAALVWATRGSSRGYLQLFLNSYNQHSPKKISMKMLLVSIELAAQIYTLNRTHKGEKSYRHHRELLHKVRVLRRGDRV